MEQRASETKPDGGGAPPPAAPAAVAVAEAGGAGAGAAGALGRALRALGPTRLAALGGVALALLGFFAYLVLRVGTPDYALLYTGLDLQDSAAIVQRLEAMGVPYELRGDGGETVLVPAERVRRLRMALAGEGLPRGGAVGYEIFDSTGALGTTSLLTDINLKRALEGELSRTIAALEDVRAARVHLVLPKRELFRRDRVEPSASVALRTARGVRPTRRQVLAVQHLVAAAVPNLHPERVTVVDERGTLLARGAGGEGEGADATLLSAQGEEFKAAYEARLRRAVEELLARSLGPGRVQAEVHAELDFDRVETTSEDYDPDSQVARSTQTVEEETRASERDGDDAVSVATNLPNAGAALGGGTGPTSSEQTERSEEIVNYEISRTVRNHTKVGGRVRRLSVAVLVDGTYAPDADGRAVYTPRGEEDLARIEALVRAAIGFDAGRGDVIEVINMPFAEPDPLESPAEDGWLAGLDGADLGRLAEILMLALLGALLILGVLRPALARLLPPPPDATPALAGAGAGTGGMAALPGGAGGVPSGGDAPSAHTAGGGSGRARVAADGGLVEDQQRVAIDQVEGGVPAVLLRQVREFIDQSPDEAVGILRGWLRET